MLRRRVPWQWLHCAPAPHWGRWQGLNTAAGPPRGARTANRSGTAARNRRRRTDKPSAAAPKARTPPAAHVTVPGLITRAPQFGDRVALRCPKQGDMTYAELRRRAGGMAVAVLDAVLGPAESGGGAGANGPSARRRRGRPRRRAGGGESPTGPDGKPLRSLHGKAVAFMCEPGHAYVVAQWAIWWAGGVAVPMCTSHPLPELVHVVNDSGAVAVVADPTHLGTVIELSTEHLDRAISMVTVFEPMAEEAIAPLPQLTAASPATIMYTSGTTGRPKGVLTTHGALQAQITDLVSTWRWTKDDHILHFLPLHHVHGVVNKLCCALWAGALVEFIKWDPVAVWRRIAQQHGLTLFMAVPTVYVQLIEAFDRADESEQARMVAGAKQLRLTVSGSAAMPVPVMKRWQRITGHTLLERYGMTEFGMALSNPMSVQDRKPGCVGLPLPSVNVRIVDDDGRVVTPPAEQPGELRVKGANMFTEYMNRPDATAEAFDSDGFFRTGDVAAWNAAAGCYTILGRASADIIKSGGHKISALEIERVLLGHSSVAEVAVVGVDDDKWGEVVGAVVRVRDECSVTTQELSSLCHDALGREKVPRRWVVVSSISKNAMGKVNKSQLKSEVAAIWAEADESTRFGSQAHTASGAGGRTRGLPSTSDAHADSNEDDIVRPNR